MRQLLKDRLLTWSMAATIVLAMLLQGLVAAHARTVMAADGTSPAYILCSPMAIADPGDDHPLKDLARDCCSTLCKLACVGGTLTAPAATPLPDPEAAADAASWAPTPAPATRERPQGPPPPARAPPLASI